MSKYADALKSAKDLLSKSYSYDNKVELKTAPTSNGVTWTSEATLTKPAKALVKADFALTDSIKVDKLQIGNDKKIVGEVSLANAAGKGTKLTFKATDGSRAAGADAVSAVFGFERIDSTSAVTLDVDALNYGVDATALVNYNGFLVGAAAKAAVAKAGGVEVSDYNVILGYKAKDYTAALQTNAKLSKVTAAYHQVVSPTVSAAAVAKFPLAFSPAPAVEVEVGLSYKVAADTTVNAKVDSGARVSFSYAQVISPLTKLTLATEFDGANISSDDHKLGLTLNITA